MQHNERQSTEERGLSALDNGHAGADMSAPVIDRRMFAPWKVIVPVLIGLSAVVLMFMYDARSENLSQIWDSVEFTPRAILFIGVAFLFMFGRDFGLTWRFRALTNHELPWSRALRVDMLCEFTSCVTPSAVGGSTLGMVYLYGEGIKFGRALTLMMTTLLLDELFFVVACPIVAAVTPTDAIFASDAELFSHGIRWTFWVIYALLAAWTLVLFMGIIVRPAWVRAVLARLFSLRFLRRWRRQADGLGESMVATSRQLKSKPLLFWLEVFGGTALSWLSRFMVVNALFMGFCPYDDPMQGIILARQFVLWVVLMLSPTPGGSGLSEWLFSEYYGDLVPTAGMALILAIFWRLISYYLYLVIGSVIIPGWLRKAIGRFRSPQTQP